MSEEGFPATIAYEVRYDDGMPLETYPWLNPSSRNIRVARKLYERCIMKRRVPDR